MLRALLLPLLLPLLLSVSCSRGSAPAAAAEPGYPRTVATFAGETLTLTRPARRVIPANGAALELLFDLGAIDRVVAVPAPAFGYLNVDLDRADWEGRTFERYLVEPMLDAAPDLVITHSWQNPETSGFLAESGVAVLDLPSPESFDDLLEALRVTARVLEVPERAEAVCADLRARHDALQARARRDVRVMSYTTFGTGGSTGGAHTTADLMIRLAGLTNAAAEHGLEGYASIDFETLLTLDPDYLLVSASEDDPFWSATLEALRGEPALASLRALREDRVLLLTRRDFTSNSHYLVQAAEHLAQLLD